MPPIGSKNAHGALPRSFLCSATAHALALGAGLFWGLLPGRSEPGAARVYTASFEPPRTADFAEEPERFEPVPIEPGEPELCESEVWTAPAHAAAEEPAPARLVAADWLSELPFAIGEPAARVAGEALPAPAPVRPEPPPAPVYTLRIDEPVPLETPPPAYPRLSRRSGEEGSVLCRLALSEQGLVTAVEILESSGFERLDRAAREALLGWRFQPRRDGGRAVATSVLHRVTFRLSES